MHLLRFFCAVTDGVSGNLGFAYLSALAETDMRIRALHVGGPAYMAAGRWQTHAELFQTPMEDRFINVVCLPFAFAITAPVAVSGRGDEEQDEHALSVQEMVSELGLPVDERAGKIIYAPSSALVELWTIDRINIAITSGAFARGEVWAPAPDERAKLTEYDLVLCPTRRDVETLQHRGVDAQHAPPVAAAVAAAFHPFDFPQERL